MKNTTTTNTAAVLLLPAGREERARSRHAVELPAVILLPAWTETTTAYIIERSWREAAAVVNRHRQHAAYMDEVAQHMHRDRLHDNLHMMQLMEDEHRAEHATARADVARYNRIAQRVRITDEQRTHAEQQRDTLRAYAHQERTHAETVNQYANSYTAHDAADIAHIIQAAIIAAARKGCNILRTNTMCAANAYINEQRAANGCSSSRTKRERMNATMKREARAHGETITEAQAEERAAARRAWASDKYGCIENARIAFNVKGAAGDTDGFYTYEQRGGVWYTVAHYKTLPPLKYEALIKDEDSESRSASALDILRTLKTDLQPADPEQLEQLAALCARAQLSERERAVIMWAMDNNNPRSVSVGLITWERYNERTRAMMEAAANTRSANAIEQRRAKGRADAITKARLYAAMAACNVPKSEWAKVKHRIKRKLEQAANVKQEQPRNVWKAADLKPAKAAVIKPRLTIYTAADTRSAAEQAEGRAYAAQDIRWTRRPYAQNVRTITAAEAAAEAAAANAPNAARAAWQRMTGSAERWTDGGSYSARYAAYIFMVNEHPAALVAWHAAAKAEAAAAAEAAQAAQAARAAEARAENISRAAAMVDSLQRWEAAQEARKAAAEAAAAEAAERAARRLEAYNAAIRAAYKRMKTTHPAATEEQRAKARKAAERAAAKVK